MSVQIMDSNLKQKTTALRQQHILDAAIRVFETHGYRGATIRLIAQEAGVSDGTIYNVFENKEALLFAVLEGLLHDAPDRPSPMASSNPPRLEELIGARWRHLTPKILAMMRVIWSAALTDRALAKRYVDTVVTPTVDGLAPFMALSHGSEADAPLQQRAIVALFLGLTLMKLLGDPVLDARIDDVPAVLSKLLKNGLTLQDID
jgi:AcrR family transcriptional regulator